MRYANSTDRSWPADWVVVATISPITRRWSKGPVDMAVFGVTDGQVIALQWARSR